MDLTLLSDSDNDATPQVPLHLLKYGLDHLKKGTFTVDKFVKYGKWGSSNKDAALQAIHGLYSYAVKQLEEMKDKNKRSLIKNGLREMNRVVTDESASSKWSRLWEEKKERELEADERRRRNRKLVSLVNQEVIQIADEQHAKLQKIASNVNGTIPQVPQILHSRVLSVPEPLQNVSDSVPSDDEHMSRIFDLNSDACLLLIPFQEFSMYADYIHNMWIDCPSSTISGYLSSIFAPLKSMPLDTWDNYFKEIAVPNLRIEKKVLTVVKATIPAFIKAFEDPKAPLQNPKTLECDFLNSYIHPVFKECLYEFAGKTGWISGEIPHNYFIGTDITYMSWGKIELKMGHTGKTRADGVATMAGRDLPLAYFEGSRPIATIEKHLADLTKIQANAVAILRQTVLDLTQWKKRVPENLRTFTAQHWNGNISLDVLECYDDVYIHNFDTVQVPKCSADSFMFVKLYKAVIGWSVLIGEMAKSYESVEENEGYSRKSFAIARYKMASAHGGPNVA
ncbi:hypothetical protein HDU80_006545 [Chytriomyces hyalinus]|nr:hypothetical protein HDU80_006545 [Chytriomyces hyalinus]